MMARHCSPEVIKTLPSRRWPNIVIQMMASLKVDEEEKMDGAILHVKKEERKGVKEGRKGRGWHWWYQFS